MKPFELRGFWFTFARAVWFAAAALVALILVASIPAYLAQLGTLTEAERIERAVAGLSAIAADPLEYWLDLANMIAQLASACACLVLAAVIFRRKPGEPIALLISFFLLVFGIVITGLLQTLAASRAGWFSVVSPLETILFAGWAVLFYLFPDGHFAPRWTRWLTLAFVPWTLATLVLRGFLLPTSKPGPYHVAALFVWYMVWPVSSLVAQVYRYRRVSNRVQRQQTKWVVYGFAVTVVVAFGLPGLIVPTLFNHPDQNAALLIFVRVFGLIWSLLVGLVPLTMGIAILRYRLFEVDLIINRTLVYGTLTTFIVGMYVLAVGGLGALSQSSNTFAPILLTTVAVIALFRPVRARLQGGVDRLMYGTHRQPRSNMPRDDKPVTPIRLSPLDYLFRALAIVGVLEIFVFAVTLIARPNAPGVIGQGLFIRLWFGLIVAPAILLVGALGVWRAPGNVVGRFLILIALGGIAAQFDFDLGAPIPTALAVEAIILFNAGLVGPSLGYLMLTFPAGRIYPPRWSRAVVVVAIVKFVGVLLELLASPGRIKIFAPALNPLFVPALAPYQPVIAWTIGITGFLLPLILLAGLISLVLRYRSAPAPERQQIKWVMWGFGLLVPTGATAFGLIFLYGFANVPFQITYVLAASAQTLFLISIAIAILRYHLFDIDILINRTLVYGSLTLVVVGVYVLAVGYLSELFHESGSFILSLLATGLIAVIFQPLRDRFQRAVNRLMYGDRDDPYAVLSRLGQRLKATLAPEAVLPTLAETIAQTLKLPYVAIALQPADGNEPEIVAAYGLPSGSVVRLPMAYQSEHVGDLLLAPRAPDETFTPAEQRLLADIAHQAGVAAHAVRLTADLQRSRERIITAREEERRRLRRDLHDGLGPKLAGQTLKLEAARDALDARPRYSRTLLDGLIVESQTLVAEIRRLVYALRPPVLDDLGLVAAIRQQAAGSELNGLRVTVTAPPTLPPLPAATEVAAYRIVQEALTNVVRHAHAHQCWVQLAVSESALRVEVIDDGVGLANRQTPGVGLASMRERAEEIGGSCVIEARDDGGAGVTATLPLPKG